MFGVTLYNQIDLQRRYVDGAAPIRITPVNGKDPRKALPLIYYDAEHQIMLAHNPEQICHFPSIHIGKLL